MVSLNSLSDMTNIRKHFNIKSTSPHFSAMVRIRHSKNTSIVSFPLLSSNLHNGRKNEKNIDVYFSSSTSTSSSILIDNADCLPRGYAANYTRNDRNITIIGEGDFQSCARDLVSLLNLNVTCKHPPCSLNGMYQPAINYDLQDFYGFSEFWYTMEGWNCSSEVSLNIQ